MPIPTVCLFDLNGTLLDLSVLDPHFAQVFGDPAVRPVWFRQTLELALTQTALDTYASFDRLADAALEMIAARRGVSVSAADKKPILAGISALPAFSDVPEALALLKKSGCRLAALTNSVQSIADAQVAHARLTPYFEAVFSADTVGQLKPGPRPYLYAAETLGVPPSEICLFAAHSWDIAGALSAGLRAAFVGRPDQALSSLGPQPEIVGTGLLDAARQIAALHRV